MSCKFYQEKQMLLNKMLIYGWIEKKIESKARFCCIYMSLKVFTLAFYTYPTSMKAYGQMIFYDVFV